MSTEQTLMVAVVDMAWLLNKNSKYLKHLVKNLYKGNKQTKNKEYLASFKI